MDESKIMNEKYVGYGALFSKNSDELDLIITDALSILREAENKNKRDHLTLANGYFHAREDSPIAHSALCYGLRKLNNARFVSHFLDSGKHSAGSEKILFDASAFYSASQLSYTRDPVRIILAQRSNLSVDGFKKGFSDSYNELLRCCYEQPFIPLTFPKIEFEISDKKTSGIQVCDYLLWVSGRNIRGKNDWHDRVQALFKSTAQPKSKSFIETEYAFMRSEPQKTTFYDISDYDSNFERTINTEFIWSLFVNVQALIKSFCAGGSNRLPAHAVHLQTDIDNFCRVINQIPPLEKVRKTAELYLKLFDTLPIINASTPKEEKPSMLFSKRFMGLLLRRELNNGARMIGWLSNQIALAEHDLG